MKENKFETCQAEAIEGLRDIGRREVGNRWDRLFLHIDRRYATCIARMLEVSDEQIETYIQEGKALTSEPTNS